VAKYIFWGFVAVFLTATGQLLLKLGAGTATRNKFLVIFFNCYTISGYLLFMVVTVLNVYVYKYIPLKYGVIFLPFTIFFVTLFSLLILKEKLSKKQIAGTMIIMVGVILFNL